MKLFMVTASVFWAYYYVTLIKFMHTKVQCHIPYTVNVSHHADACHKATKMLAFTLITFHIPHKIGKLYPIFQYIMRCDLYTNTHTHTLKYTMMQPEVQSTS